MSDKIKIEKVEAFLKMEKLSSDQELEMIEHALSISEQEDRDLELEKIAIMLANAGNFDRSIDLLNKIELGYEKAEGSTKIASLLISLKRVHEATKYLKLAESSATQSTTHWQAAELLNNIAKCYESMGEREMVVSVLNKAISIAKEGEITEKLQDSLDSSSVLGDISQTLFKIGETEQAYMLASSIKNAWKRERALGLLQQFSEQS